MKLERFGCRGAASIGLALLGLSVSASPSISHEDLTFTTWTGPYMRSQMLGFVRPYENETGKTVSVEHYNGGIDEIRDQVESANVVWDVVDLTQADSLRACEEGLLENLEDIGLPPGSDGTPAPDDFVDGALNSCGVGVIIWATAFAYDEGTFDVTQPSSIEDFFDTDKFPGARAIRNDPTVVMEWALMADGVARDQVYATLETDDGVKRALKVMDSIKPGLRLWDTGRQPVRMLNDGEVVMSSIWATTGAMASREAGAEFEIVWDGRVMEMDLFGVPKGSPNRAEAFEFIRHASSSRSLAEMVSVMPNGPTRKSSLKMLPEPILAQLPNNPDIESDLVIQSDADWWSKNHTRLEEAFDAWLAESGRKGASGTVR